jgi:hypothetical protein
MNESDTPGGLRFEIRSYFRHSNAVDGVVMATVGGRLQEATWRSVVEEVVRRSGGEAPEGVQAQNGELDTGEAERVERWVEALVQRRHRESEQAMAATAETVGESADGSYTEETPA